MAFDASGTDNTDAFSMISFEEVVPSRSFRYPEGCAAPGDVRCQCNTRGLLSKLEKIPPQRKIHVTSKSPVGDISDVTLIRTDTTLDHSQKAEKVCSNLPILPQLCQQTGVAHVSAKRRGGILKHTGCKVALAESRHGTSMHRVSYQ